MASETKNGQRWTIQEQWRIVAEALVDRRTLLAVADKQPTRQMSHERIRRACKKLRIRPPPAWVRP